MKSIISMVVAALFISIQPVFGQATNQAQILFEGWSTRDAEIYVMDADGQNLRNLTNSEFHEVSPAWSADGQQIVFVSDRDDTEDDIYLDYSVYTMDADGQNLRMIMDNVNYEAQASWSPDGQLIAVVTDAEATEGDAKLTCALNIMKPDGSDVQTLFTTPQCNDFKALWSPDGSHLLVNANDAVYSVRMADAAVVQLTTQNNNTTNSYAPVWSPDGSKVAYVVDQHDSGENYELYLMNADGSGQKRLTNNPVMDIAPRFTAEGKALLFSSGDDKANELYIYDLEANAIKQLTDTKTQKFWWTLSPDISMAVYSERSQSNEDTIYLLDMRTMTAKPLGETVYKDAGHYSWRPTGSGA